MSDFGENYPPDWKHAIIHLSPTGEMHSDGDHAVRNYIENQILALRSQRDALREALETVKQSPMTGPTTKEYCQRILDATKEPV